MKNLLVLCTGNSARSILGEALFNHHCAGRVRAYSAGSDPRGEVHPGALAVLARNNIPNVDYRSKSWDEFTGKEAPEMDIVITVCNNAADELCPFFPGKQVKAHWGIEDPADAMSGDAEMQAFDRTFAEMNARVTAFCKLPLADLTDAELKQELQIIGLMEGAT